MMGKATFLVKVIRKGRENDYRDFWVHGLTKNDAGEELHSALVGFVEAVEAKNKKEAIAFVRAKHPGLQIDEKATLRRLG